MFRSVLLKLGAAIKPIQRFVDPEELMTMCTNVDPADAGSDIVQIVQHVKCPQERVVGMCSATTCWSLDRVVMLRRFASVSARVR